MSYQAIAGRVRALALLALILSAFSTIGNHAARAQGPDPAPKSADPAPLDTHVAPQHGIFTPGIDLSLGAFGQFTETRMPMTTTVYPQTGTGYTQVTQGAALSGGVLATIHQSFSPWLGYNVNFGYTRFTEHYSNAEQFVPNATSGPPASSSFVKGDMRTGMYEVTVAPVIEGPRTRRFSTFAQFGGGGLFFEPGSNAKLGASQQTRPAMVFGVGANFKLSEHLDMRAEYRGLFYKSPDFNVGDITPGVTPPNSFPMTRLFTVTSTPAVSLVYHFGPTKTAKARAASAHQNDR